MKSFSQYMLYEESTEVSTALETVLGVSYESVAQNDPKILTDAMSSDGNFKKAKAYWDTGNPQTDLQNLQIFGANIITAGAPSNGSFDFQEKGSLTSFWKENGGSNVTSKTDITLGGNQYSVKNADGAQLMSGKKGESTATAIAAAREVNPQFENSALVQELIASIDKLSQVTTEGYYASAGNLQRLKDDAGKHKNLYDLAVASKKQLDKYDKEFADLKAAKKKAKRDKVKIKKLEDDFAKLWPPGGGGRGFSPSTGRGKGWDGTGELGTTGRPTLGRDLPKVIAKGPQPKELQTTLSATNQKFTRYVDASFKRNSAAVGDALNNLFTSSEKYKLEFVYEASTGNYKFGKNSKQAAHHMLSWTPAGNVKDFNIHIYDLASSSSDIIGKYAKTMNLDVAWKSSSTHKHKGYNVFQSIRIGVGKIMEEVEHTENMLYEEYAKLTEQLDEGYLSEWKFFDKVKDMATNFVATIKDLGTKILSFFTEAVNKIKDAAKDGVQALGAVFGYEMDVNDTLRNQELSV
jgi:hypothetical protein